MRIRMFAVILSMSFIAPVGTRAQETSPVDSLALARQYTAWLYAGEADSLVAHSTEGARGSFSTVEQWNGHAETIRQRAGEELSVVEETWKLRNGDCQYWRVAAFSGMDDLLLVRWVLTPEGRIAAIGLGPNSQAPPVDRETCSYAP